MAIPRVRLCQALAGWLDKRVREKRARVDDCAMRLGHKNRWGVMIDAISIAAENNMVSVIVVGCSVQQRYRQWVRRLGMRS